MLDFFFILVDFDFLHHASLQWDESVFAAAGDACAYCWLLLCGMHFLIVGCLLFAMIKIHWHVHFISVLFSTPPITVLFAVNRVVSPLFHCIMLAEK